MGQVCVHCGHQGESTDPYCRSCGELNDGSTIVLGAPERRGETSTRRAAPITIALIILGLAGFAWLTQSPVQETSVGPTVVTNPPRRISVPSTTVGSNPVLDGFFSASTIDASDASLIVLTSAGLSHIVLATGTVSPVLVDEPARGEEISVIDGDLVYLSSTGAWVVPLNGGLTEFLGPANRVLPSLQPDRVWIGVHLEPEPHSQPLLWTEVDQAGDVHRDQIRTLPFPFVYSGSHVGRRWGVPTFGLSGELLASHGKGFPRRHRRQRSRYDRLLGTRRMFASVVRPFVGRRT